MLRIELLNKLLSIPLESDAIKNELKSYNWDSDEELVFLNRGHIINVLKKYINDEINENNIELWANLIEGREDIGREDGYNYIINTILHELANPNLTEHLTKERSNVLMVKLS